MTRKLPYLDETPSQTAGPFVHIGLAPRAAGFDIYDADPGGTIAGPRTRGERIRIEGMVLDGTGDAVRDALIEVWQADPQGQYIANGDFRGWGRVVPDFATGQFEIDTVKPGPNPMPDGTLQAPHLALWIVARGINTGLQTRIYFDDEENGADPLLVRVPPSRRRTLLARRIETGHYRFDIRLQGEHETVFLDI